MHAIDVVAHARTYSNAWVNECGYNAIIVTFLIIKKNKSSVRPNPSTRAKNIVRINDIAPQMLQQHILFLVVKHSQVKTDILPATAIASIQHYLLGSQTYLCQLYTVLSIGALHV